MEKVLVAMFYSKNDKKIIHGFAKVILVLPWYFRFNDFS